MEIMKKMNGMKTIMKIIKKNNEQLMMFPRRQYLLEFSQ